MQEIAPPSTYAGEREFEAKPRAGVTIACVRIAYDKPVLETQEVEDVQRAQTRRCIAIRIAPRRLDHLIRIDPFRAVCERQVSHLLVRRQEPLSQQITA